MPADTDALAHAFGFTEHELNLNRSGQLSERQSDLLASIRTGMRRWTKIAIVVMVAWIAVLGGVASAATGGLPTPALIAFGAVAVVALGLFAVAHLVGRHRSADIRAGRVSLAAGRASTRLRKRTSEHGSHTTYELTVDGTRFLLSSENQLNAFEDGQLYEVFYVKAPGTPILLSVGGG